MTPTRDRVFVAAFLCLAAAIAVNALFYQDKRYAVALHVDEAVTNSINSSKPAPSRTKLSRKKTRAPKGRKAPRLSGRRLVRAIQRELKSKRYMPGNVDGQTGIITSAAIMAYEFDNRLALTGKPDAGLLRRIVLGPTLHKRNPPSDKSSGDKAKKITQAVQKTLAELGYAPGPIDGQPGASTRSAIRSFEKDRRLPQTGRVSGRLVYEIKKVTGTALVI